MRDLTLLIAHPDDEILFLWPFLDRAFRIVSVVSDEFNADRAWCSRRKYALAEVCAEIGCQFHCLEANSGFYQMPTRNGALKRFAEEIGEALAEATAIATHNAWGEYGHQDHKLCHHIARTVAGHRPVYQTDIAVQANWLPIAPWQTAGLSREHILDRARFDRLKEIYVKEGCWTYDQEPVETCRVYTC